MDRYVRRADARRERESSLWAEHSISDSGNLTGHNWNPSGGPVSRRFTNATAVGTGTVAADGSLTASITVDASEPAGADPIVVTQGSLSVTVPSTVDRAASNLTVTTATLPEITKSCTGFLVGCTLYLATPAGSGGVPAYRWSLVSGALPPGLSSSSNGEIIGWPTLALPGNDAFVVEVTGSTGVALPRLPRSPLGPAAR